MSLHRRIVVVLVAVAAVVSTAAAVTAPTADAAVASFKPARAQAKVAVYRLQGVKPAEIRRATLRRAGHTRRLNVTSVRRAAARGQLRLRLLRGRSARIVRRVRLRASRPGARGRHARVVRRRLMRRVVKRNLRSRLVIVTQPQAPPPAPPATASSCGPASLGSFGVDAWPGGCWRPYGDASPFNRPIGDSPRLHPRSAAIVQHVVGASGGPSNLVAGDAGTEWDYSHPVYWAQPSDPVYTVDCVESWGTCEVEGMQVQIPAAAQPAAGSDGHLTVVDQATGWEYDFWQVRDKPAGGGKLTVSWGGRTRIDGDGLDSNATAANFGSLGGIIRAQELEAGEIRHALFLVIKCSSGEKVYPANGTGAKCGDATDAPPMGTRFQLAMSDPEIDALAVPAWKKTVLRAMARYGLYFGDTGGSGMNLQFESGASYTSFGREDAMVSFARRAGMKVSDGKAVFEIADGVDWTSRLRVVDPCEAQGTC
ncbi:MAG TPA: hypothetical protein VEX36_00310 [Thermoleophilaceae bacterium]|nr:hypothetical protein [Thermoleophilaceae bacterium]